MPSSVTNDPKLTQWRNKAANCVLIVLCFFDVMFIGQCFLYHLPSSNLSSYNSLSDELRTIQIPAPVFQFIAFVLSFCILCLFFFTVCIFVFTISKLIANRERINTPPQEYIIPDKFQFKQRSLLFLEILWVLACFLNSLYLIAKHRVGVLSLQSAIKNFPLILYQLCQYVQDSNTAVFLLLQFIIMFFCVEVFRRYLTKHFESKTKLSLSKWFDLLTVLGILIPMYVTREQIFENVIMSSIFVLNLSGLLLLLIGFRVLSPLDIGRLRRLLVFFIIGVCIFFGVYRTYSSVIWSVGIIHTMVVIGILLGVLYMVMGLFEIRLRFMPFFLLLFVVPISIKYPSVEYELFRESCARCMAQSDEAICKNAIHYGEKLTEKYVMLYEMNNVLSNSSTRIFKEICMDLSKIHEDREEINLAKIAVEKIPKDLRTSDVRNRIDVLKKKVAAKSQ